MFILEYRSFLILIGVTVHEGDMGFFATEICPNMELMENLIAWVDWM